MIKEQVSRVICGDSVEQLKSIDTDSIDYVITSPPYHLGKEYEKTQLYSEYCEMMFTIFSECNRVLKPGRYMTVNFGDYFNSGNRFYESDVPSCYPATINYYNWGVTQTGFDLQATRIWRKQFARMGIPFVCNTHPRPIFDYEHVWTFRKKNGAKEEWVNDRKLSQRGVIGENWTSSASIDKHCAAFPVELPKWAIDVYTQNPGEIILDPFAGSGTTAIAAISKGMQYIMIEKNHSYVEYMKNRILEHVGHELVGIDG